MPAPHNPFKQAMAEGRVQLGCWLGMANSYAAEMVATAGFDWLLVDGEHAPNDLRSILQQLQVLKGSASHPVVRLPMGETWAIKQALDAGAQSLLIPMVESAVQARDLVRAVRYPPRGRRGVGAALARASGFSGIPDYFATADDQIFLAVQVETRAGVDALDEILAVEGVDGVFIGPSDLSADLGYGARLDVPELRALIGNLLRRIRDAGKAPGILVTEHDWARECLGDGARFLATAIDVLLFTRALRQEASAARGLLG